jgi:hypothetical protein
MHGRCTPGAGPVYARRCRIERRAPATPETHAVRRINWWTVLLTLAVSIVIVWLAGRWLLHMFLGLQGGKG